MRYSFRGEISRPTSRYIILIGQPLAASSNLATYFIIDIDIDIDIVVVVCVLAYNCIVGLILAFYYNFRGEVRRPTSRSFFSYRPAGDIY